MNNGGGPNINGALPSFHPNQYTGATRRPTNLEISGVFPGACVPPKNDVCSFMRNKIAKIMSLILICG
jgi:hypothetical protein